MSDYYDHGSAPADNSFGDPAVIRAEFDLITQNISGKLPPLTANGDKIIAVNSGATALVALTTTGTGSAVRATSPTLVAPALGTPTALVGTNITGTAAGLTAGSATTAATVTTNANLTGPITSVGNATAVAAQTGTGSTFVMQASPTLTTPNIGTPTAGVATNLTGLPLTSGVTGTLPVANGGTGIATTTAYSPVFTGTTATGAFQASLGPGTSGQVLTSAGAGAIPAWATVSNTVVPTRQTILSGPVDSSGFSAFVGATGSTTVTATGTLIATAANGFSTGGQVDRIGSIVNPSWTGLSTNGTMYLYLDIDSASVVTTGSGTLAPTYRAGGADVVTNGQFTFNWMQMVGKVGNGASAAQAYRVYVGEVTVAGGVVTVITWYTMGDRIQTADVACTAVATQTTFTHNFGVPEIEIAHYLRCVTGQVNIVAGQVVGPTLTNNGTAYASLQATQTSRNQATVTTGSSTAYCAWDRLTGNISALTSANFTQFIVAKRSW